MASFEIKWRAPEFEYREKTMSWYWLSIAGAALLLGVAVWQKNFLLAVFIVLAEILFLFWGNREPELLDFVLSDKGFAIGTNKFYPYSEIKDFGVGEVEGEWGVVVFTFSRSFRPVMQVIVPKTNLPDLQKSLKLFLPQVEVQETITDALERFLKF